MLFRETVAVYCENHKEHISTLCVGRMQSVSVLKQVVHIVTAVMTPYVRLDGVNLINFSVGFEVLPMGTMKIALFWVITPCSSERAR
jgi:hypothetical protein